MTAFCFMHIGKVGGSAVIRELANRFAGRRIVHASPWSMDAMSEEDLAAADLIMGHWSARHLSKLPARRFVFTMVREPVDRVLSAYAFLRQWRGAIDETNDRAVLLARELSFEDFIEHDEAQVLRVVRDHQTRFLGGDWRDHAPVDDATFSRALKNVETFDVVGVHESYRQSMAILCNRMGWPPWPAEVRVNETAGRVPVDRLSAEVAARVCELNPCDMEIVVRARERLRSMGCPPVIFEKS